MKAGKKSAAKTSLKFAAIFAVGAVFGWGVSTLWSMTAPPQTKAIE